MTTHSAKCCDGNKLQLRCQLCPKSPTYWRLNLSNEAKARLADPWAAPAPARDSGVAS